MSSCFSMDSSHTSCQLCLERLQRDNPFIGPLITVFQASPLGYQTKDGVTHTVKELNYKLERDALSLIFQDRIDFRIATINSIGDFLLHEKHQLPRQHPSATCSALHFSCHGNKEFLAVEDSWGGAECLLLDDLRKWMEKTTAFEFVFLASCHSRSIGEALVAAGVNHVICAEDDDMEVTTGFAVEFSKRLYLAMMRGSSVQKAFEIAQLQMDARECYHFQSFCLLPIVDAGTGVKWDHHHVHLSGFNTSGTMATPQPTKPPSAAEYHKASSWNGTYPPRAGAAVAAIRYNGNLYYSSSSLKAMRTRTPSFSLAQGTIVQLSAPTILHPTHTPYRSSSTRISRGNRDDLRIVAQLRRTHGPPKPRGDFLRHDGEKFRIVRAINAAQIVWITGVKGCGKTAVVQASCSFLQDRLALNELEAIFWSKIVGEGTPGGMQTENSLKDLLQTVRTIPSRPFLIVIDAKELSEKSGQELAKELDLVVKESPLVKLLVIHQTDDSKKLRIGTFQCEVRNIKVNRLNLESTIKLFAKFSEHVSNNVYPGIHCPESLWDHMEPPDATDRDVNDQHYDALGWTGGCNYASAASALVSGLPKRHEAVFKQLGEGLPSKVILVAREMNADDYRNIMYLGEYEDLDRRDYQFHNALLHLQLDLTRAMVSSIRNKWYDQLSLLQKKFDCVSMVKQEFKSLPALRDDLDEIRDKMSAARKKKGGINGISDLFKRQQGIWERLQGEVNALLKSPTDVSNPEVMELCCNKQSTLQTLLLRVQDVLADFLSNPQNHLVVTRLGGSTKNTTISDCTLMRVENMLVQVSNGKLPESMLIFEEMMLSLAKNEDVLPNRRPTSVPITSEIEKIDVAQDKSMSQMEAVLLLQATIRRYLAKRAEESAETQRSPIARSSKENCSSHLQSYFDEFLSKNRKPTRRQSLQTATTAGSTDIARSSVTSASHLSQSIHRFSREEDPSSIFLSPSNSSSWLREEEGSGAPQKRHSSLHWDVSDDDTGHHPSSIFLAPSNSSCALREEEGSGARQKRRSSLHWQVSDDDTSNHQSSVFLSPSNSSSALGTVGRCKVAFSLDCQSSFDSARSFSSAGRDEDSTSAVSAGCNWPRVSLLKSTNRQWHKAYCTGRWNTGSSSTMDKPPQSVARSPSGGRGPVVTTPMDWDAAPGTLRPQCFDARWD